MDLPSRKRHLCVHTHVQFPFPFDRRSEAHLRGPRPRALPLDNGALLTQLGLNFRTVILEATQSWIESQDFKYRERIIVQSLPFSHFCKILHYFFPLETFKYKRKLIRLLIMCPKAGFLMKQKEAMVLITAVCSEKGATAVKRKNTQSKQCLVPVHWNPVERWGGRVGLGGWISWCLGPEGGCC